MGKKIVSTFSRKGPDIITEELAAMFSRKAQFEFKPLFDILLAKLRSRNLASGGEEMMRLRTYEKLQSMVARGVVKKTVTNETTKIYMGVSAPLRVLIKELKTNRAEWAERVSRKATIARSTFAKGAAPSE